MAAICGVLHPDGARRVTAVPRRSWKCRSASPSFARSKAVPHDERKPSPVHGSPKVLRRTGPSDFSVRCASRAAFSGAPTGMTIRFFFFPRRCLFGCSRMCVPSYCDHAIEINVPWRWPVHSGGNARRGGRGTLGAAYDARSVPSGVQGTAPGAEDFAAAVLFRAVRCTV